jgi:hypothetical protein
MNLSEHEKAIIAIEALANQIGDRGNELEDQILLNIASDLQLFMITAMMGDLNDFLNYVNDFREKKIQENLEEMEDLRMEMRTGKKATPLQKIARKNLSTSN